jgi:hypothetical protein
MGGRRPHEVTDASTPGRVPSEAGEHPLGEAGALLLVVVGPRVVDGVVEERGSDDRPLVGERDLDGQLADVAQDPRDVSDAVVATMGLPMAGDDVGQRAGRLGPSADRRGPRRLELDLVADRASLPQPPGRLQRWPC